MTEHELFLECLDNITERSTSADCYSVYVNEDGHWQLDAYVTKYEDVVVLDRYISHNPASKEDLESMDKFIDVVYTNAQFYCEFVIEHSDFRYITLDEIDEDGLEGLAETWFGE